MTKSKKQQQRANELLLVIQDALGEYQRLSVRYAVRGSGIPEETPYEDCLLALLECMERVSRRGLVAARKLKKNPVFDMTLGDVFDQIDKIIAKDDKFGKQMASARAHAESVVNS